MTSRDAPDLARLAQRYGEAWNAHDLDAVMAMHTDDTVFRLHLLDAPEITGRTAVRDGFAGLLALWPDIFFSTDALVLGGGFFVHQYVITGTLAAPMPFGAALAHPTGTAVRFAGVDVITVCGERVHRKETYLDTAGAAARLGLFDAVGAAR
ncbi:nuclear transport factor 2 family protein [Pseudonocardia nigra]|uniref:nuclear transport factor 2 family protein n=1 Tax=Pseudonocardia nigra TaxID=1921578 RepID=UPI001C5D80D2|nr:nuclear transport factor 2 family protein [Pseudonocardia nigra]